MNYAGVSDYAFKLTKKPKKIVLNKKAKDIKNSIRSASKTNRSGSIVYLVNDSGRWIFQLADLQIKTKGLLKVLIAEIGILTFFFKTFLLIIQFPLHT